MVFIPPSYLISVRSQWMSGAFIGLSYLKIRKFIYKHAMPFPMNFKWHLNDLFLPIYEKDEMALDYLTNSHTNHILIYQKNIIPNK